MEMTMIGISALFAATCIAAIASAASPSPSAADCSAVVLEMLPCVDYITVGSTAAKASEKCCDATEDLLKTKGECLCEALKQSGGVQFNLTRALGLPAACGISTPLPDCGIALPPGIALAPVPNSKSPPLAPGAAAPSPIPSSKAPAPALAPGSRAPTLAPNSRSPAPSPSRSTPMSAPSMAPTFGPVSPPAPETPAPEVSPGSAPGSPPAPMGPSSDDSPAVSPTPSNAPLFTLSSNLIVPLLLTLLASFRPL